MSTFTFAPGDRVRHNVYGTVATVVVCENFRGLERVIARDEEDYCIVLRSSDLTLVEPTIRVDVEVKQAIHWVTKAKKYNLVPIKPKDDFEAGNVRFYDEIERILTEEGLLWPIHGWRRATFPYFRVRLRPTAQQKNSPAHCSLLRGTCRAGISR